MLEPLIRSQAMGVLKQLLELLARLIERHETQLSTDVQLLELCLLALDIATMAAKRASAQNLEAVFAIPLFDRDIFRACTRQSGTC